MKFLYWVKLFIMAVASVMFWYGGAYQHNFRRFFMPVVIGIGVSLASHCWWLGFTVLPVMGILCIGYGEKSFLYKYLSDAGARGMYMFLSAMVIGLGATIAGHVNWYFFLPYCILSGIIGAVLRTGKQYIVDFIFGAYLCSIIFLVR